MSKLTKEQIETLSKLGVKGKTDEEVRPEILKRLKKEDIEEVDNDPIEDLINILSAFAVVEPPKGKKVVVEVEDEDETEEESAEDEEEAEEIKTSLPKKVKKEVVKTVKKEESKKDETLDKKTVKVEKSEKKPVTEKVTKKAVKKPIPYETDSELEELAKEAKGKKLEKDSKKVDVSIKSKSGFVNLNDISQKEIIDKSLVSLLSKFNLQVTYGTKIVSFRNKSTVSGRCVLTFDDLKIKQDGDISLFIGFNAFRLLPKETAEEKLRSFIPEEYKDNVTLRSSGLLSVKNITNKDVKKILTKELLEFMENYIKKLDGKLNENRKKMTEQMGE